MTEYLTIDNRRITARDAAGVVDALHGMALSQDRFLSRDEYREQIAYYLRNLDLTVDPTTDETLVVGLIRHGFLQQAQ